MEEEVSVLSTLLEAVTTVLSNFFAWVTSATTSLIANPVVQLLFGMIVAMLITRFVIGLIKNAGKGGKSGRRKR